MRGVLVLGSSGAGQSIFARQSGHQKILPAVEIERLFRKRRKALATRDRFFTDGAKRSLPSLGSSTAPMDPHRNCSCRARDPLVPFDQSRIAHYARITHRVLSSFEKPPNHRAKGSPERFDLGVIRSFWRDLTMDSLQTLEALGQNKVLPRKILLRSVRKAAAFLKVASQA